MCTSRLCCNSNAASCATAAALLLLATGLGAQSNPAKPIRGFSPAAAQQQLQLEERLNALLSRDSTAAYFKELTAEPHPAGSERNHQLALWMAERWRGFGIEDVRLHRYDVLLPWPEQVAVTMLSPTRFEATLKEDCYPEDPQGCVGSGLTYLGMSASGDVTGELVYASSGNPADYDWLESQGIDLHGKIAIVRYSNPYSYRGFKALTAERRGLKALLIYSDPQDGYRQGLTFPNGPWGPESHIQRGAITYDFMVAGDPLTPGWASVPRSAADSCRRRLIDAEDHCRSDLGQRRRSPAQGVDRTRRPSRLAGRVAVHLPRGRRSRHGARHRKDGRQHAEHLGRGRTHPGQRASRADGGARQPPRRLGVRRGGSEQRDRQRDGAGAGARSVGT